MTHEQDMINYILSRARQMAPELTLDMSSQIEKEARQIWGGDDIYIAKTMSNRTELRAALKRRLQKNGVKAVMAEGVNLSRSTLYGILKA